SDRDCEAAVQTGLRLLALDPLQDSVHRTLMRIYAQLGRRRVGVRQYQLCVDALKRELGVEPEPETRQLYQEILRRRAAGAENDPSPLRGRPPDATDTRLSVPT